MQFCQGKQYEVLICPFHYPIFLHATEFMQEITILILLLLYITYILE